jgi:hypothetical protein
MNISIFRCKAVPITLHFTCKENIYIQLLQPAVCILRSQDLPETLWNAQQTQIRRR